MKDGIPRWLQHHYKMCCEKGGHHGRQVSRSKKVNLTSFLFFFYFLFDFISLFSIFRTTGVRVDWSCYQIKSPDGEVTRQITRLGRI